MHDKYGLTIDRMLCHPQHRGEFDQIAQLLVRGEKSGLTTQDHAAYLLRKAALRLRKSRRLRPELVLRVADWNRQILIFSSSDIFGTPEVVPERPGVYIFRDATGCLYIGESRDLRRRVLKHLDRSDNHTLGAYLWRAGHRDVQIELHVFDPESKAKEKSVRRAYESELIRSRTLRFNVQP